MIKRITDELKTIAVSLYDSSRQKSNIIRLLFAFLLIFSGMALSSTHNSIALILIFSGMAVCITTYIYRWKSPLRFIILTVFSVIGFPVFVSALSDSSRLLSACCCSGSTRYLRKTQKNYTTIFRKIKQYGLKK